MTKTITPRSRPAMGFDELAGHVLSKAGINLRTYDIVRIVGFRGYYKDTMGKPGQNDTGIYDDAIFVCQSGKLLGAFNANTDPSKRREGHGFGEDKGSATLLPGVYPAYRVGTHYGRSTSYTAVVQRLAPVNVMRAGQPDYPDSGFFGINIHRGGAASTSSEGCQTIPPEQWQDFMYVVSTAALRAKVKEPITYILLDNDQPTT